MLGFLGITVFQVSVQMNFFNWLRILNPAVYSQPMGQETGDWGLYLCI